MVIWNDFFCRGQNFTNSVLAHGGQQSIIITNYVMSHKGLLIFKVWKISKMVPIDYLEKVTDFKCTDPTVVCTLQCT